MSYCKFYKEKEQVSYNSGQTWSDIPGTYRKGDLYELDSPDCSPIPINRKWTAIKDTINIVKDCDSSSSITSSDLSGGISFNYFIVGNCVKNIDDYVFFDIGYERRNMFSSLTIGENVENIGTCAFMMCGSLTSLYIPDSVTSIGSEAFRDCSGLTTIRFGSGLTEIGHGVFTSCIGLTSIGVTGSGASVEIPNNIRTISSQCFDSCSGLTSINMPSSVTSIGSNAFNSCTNLTSIDIPSGVTSIGSFAFAYCSSLNSITVNTTMPPTLGSSAFYNTNDCPIYVPCESVDTYKAASGWSDYASRIQCISERWINNPDGYECSGTTKMTQEKKQVSYDNGSTWVDTNPLVTRIGSTVIQYDSTDCGYVPPVIGIKYKLTLNDSSIVSAECDSSTITTRTITKEEVSSQYSGSVVSAEVGECVNIIGFYAFYGCSGLTSITIPDSVTSIGGYAFSACTSLTSIDIPSGVTEIGERAFIYCIGLSSIDIPSGVTSIGYGTFLNCSGMTSCTIGSGVTTIGSSTFARCYSLTSITIPSGVTSIGDYAFWNCTGFTSVTVNATIPPTLGSNAFSNTNNCPIYVPAESVDAYKTATRWSDYANRIQAIP